MKEKSLMVLSVSKNDKEEHLGNCRLNSFILWPGKIMEYTLISKHIKRRQPETVCIDLARANCAWLALLLLWLK